MGDGITARVLLHAAFDFGQKVQLFHSLADRTPDQAYFTPQPLAAVA
ncbi:MAG: hypothetical protein ABI587_10195 [Gemmatimonadales bacterium]